MSTGGENVNEPDAVFARAQDRLAADTAAANIQRGQRDHADADRLLRRFAERMRGTEKTKIELGPGPNRSVRQKTSLFHSYTYEIEIAEGRPSVMGWAFLTGFDSKPMYGTVRHGDPDSRDGTYETYSVLAVDSNGQLYLASARTRPPRKMGLFEVAVVQGFRNDGGRPLWTIDGRKWNGVGREVLGWCGHTSPMSPGIFNDSDYAYRAYERALADYEKKTREIDQFLAPGLAAALSAAGR
jgi:hypothetical protein